jgi:hypothetical protein
VNANYITPFQRFGIKTESDVLGESEQTGKEILPPTPAAVEAVDTAWGWLETFEMTKSQPKPPVFCFRSLMEAGAQTMGFCDSKGVHFEEAHASGSNRMLLQTALEECAHWVTKATDNSRDFQDYLLRLIVEVMA